MATQQEVASALAGIRSKYMGAGPTGGDQAMTEMANYLKFNNIDQSISQYGTNYGLAPAMNTLGGAEQRALDRIDQTQGMVTDLYSQGQGYLQPYRESGQGANQLQAALSGAMGPQAQAEAYAQFNQSPGQNYLTGESERAIMRNAAATGGLGGGNLLKELQANATGLAQQDFNNYYNRLGSVADRGFGAAGAAAGLRGNEAGTQAGLGQYAASIPIQIAGQQAAMQYQAGRDLAGNYGQIGSGLANAANQQGQGLSGIYGNYGTNLTNLLTNFNQMNQQGGQNLAGLLGNNNMNASGQMMGSPSAIPGQTNYMGQVGNMASGIGNLLGALS
jgi:hypothetical protein